MEATEPASYERTEHNQPSRHGERARYDAETVHAVLDEGLIAHVAFVADERAQVLPMLYVRIGEAVYVHGSTGSQLARMAARRGPVAVALEVTLVDEFVLAKATFSHSANYRSVVAHGPARLVEDATRKSEILAFLVEHLVPGRGADARPPSTTELRQTAVLELALDDVGAKVRSGDPIDAPEDASIECWTGLRPLLSTWGTPRPAAGLPAAVELPAYLVGDDERRFSA